MSKKEREEIVRAATDSGIHERIERLQAALGCIYNSTVDSDAVDLARDALDADNAAVGSARPVTEDLLLRLMSFLCRDINRIADAVEKLTLPPDNSIPENFR